MSGPARSRADYYDDYAGPPPARSGRGARRPARRRAPSGPPSTRTIRAAITGAAIGAATFIVLALVIGFSFYGYFQMSGRILLGVRVGDVRLGNMSAEQAAAALESAWSADGQGLVLSDGQRTWNASPAELGLTLDAAATAQRALAVGRGQSMAQEIGILLDALLTGYSVPPVVALDQAAARAGLEAWAGTVSQPPRDATIRFEDGQVVAVPGVPGRSLDIEATLAALAADPSQAMRGGSLPLIMVPVAPHL